MMLIIFDLCRISRNENGYSRGRTEKSCLVVGITAISKMDVPTRGKKQKI